VDNVAIATVKFAISSLAKLVNVKILNEPNLLGASRIVHELRLGRQLRIRVQHGRVIFGLYCFGYGVHAEAFAQASAAAATTAAAATADAFFSLVQIAPAVEESAKLDRLVAVDHTGYFNGVLLLLVESFRLQKALYLVLFIFVNNQFKNALNS
jgi:hypothetical protein